MADPKRRSKTGTGNPPRPPKGDDIEMLREVISDFQQRDNDRKDELQRLALMFQQLTQANSIECILSNGFEGLTALLAPLENLGNLAPYREPLGEDRAARMDGILRALDRPDWSSVTSLPLPNNPVDPIGAKAPPPAYEGSMRS